jgi:hypothetical protein
MNAKKIVGYTPKAGHLLAEGFEMFQHGEVYRIYDYMANGIVTSDKDNHAHFLSYEFLAENFDAIAGEEANSGEYVGYEVYECPANPYEYGKYIGKTPIYEQAVKAKEEGKNRFIKGVKHDGSRVMVL